MPLPPHSHRHPSIKASLDTFKRGHSCRNGYLDKSPMLREETQVGLFSKVMTCIRRWHYSNVHRGQGVTIKTSFQCLPVTSAGTLSQQMDSSEECLPLAGSHCPVWPAFHHQCLRFRWVSSFPHASLSLLDNHLYAEGTSADRPSAWQESLKHLSTSASDTRLSMLRTHFLTNANTCGWLIISVWPRPPGL